MSTARFLFTAALGAALLPVSASAQIFDRCDHTRQLNSSVAVAAGTELRIEAGAGSLRVRGVEGLREARIRGTACASSAALLDQLSVSVERGAGQVSIETSFPDRDGVNETMRIDLILEVPMGVAAEISDGSGDAEISGLGDATVTDGSGNLRVNDMRGTLALTDGSGGLDIDGVEGDVRIDDGSGDVNVASVGGSVRVTDGSGSIDVRGVRGDLIVPNDGSGGIEWANIGGRITVPSRR